jgi:phage repressor protein C with HTH and peptisase S24 domain
MPGGDSTQIYQDLMLFKPEGLSPNAWAMKAGVSRTVWSDMRRHGNPSRRTLDKLLTAAGSSLAEFEALRIGKRPVTTGAAAAGLTDRIASAWGGAQLPALPLIASAIAGEWGDRAAGIELTELRPAEIIDRLPRPVSLTNDAAAYAFTIVGNAMWPRFRPGRRVAVSPRAGVAIGDDVVVKLKAETNAAVVPILVGELVRKGARGVELRQFNPDAGFQVEIADVAALEKILGELI